MENRLKTFEVNVEGTKIVLKLASKDKKKVMLASSSEVYGKNGKVPFSEDDDSVLGPTTVYRWSYADTKRIGEELAFANLDERGLPIVIMRLFNTVGPKQLGRYGMVVPRFTERALAGEPLPVYGEGVQTRCFTYIDDVLKAIIALAECSAAVGQIFNIGSDEEISISDLARKIIKLASSSSTIEYIPYKEAYGEGFEDMKRRVPNISKIYQFVGWKPQVGLDETLTKMIEYFREKRERK
jgi:UDP-glucose 4-epimerase